MADPYWGNVVLAMHMDDVGLPDLKGKSVTLNGGMGRNIATYKFGGASALFDATNDYISIPNSSDFNFGSGAFDIDLWCRTTTASGPTQTLLSTTTLGVPGYTGFYLIRDTAAKIVFYWFDDVGGGNSCTSTTSISTGAFHYIEVSCDGTNVRLFFNGVLEATTPLSRPMSYSTAPLLIGAYEGPAILWNGYIDDLRITKGAFRNTASYSVPTAAFEEGSTISSGTSNGTSVCSGIAYSSGIGVSVGTSLATSLPSGVGLGVSSGSSSALAISSVKGVGVSSATATVQAYSPAYVAGYGASTGTSSAATYTPSIIGGKGFAGGFAIPKAYNPVHSSAGKTAGSSLCNAVNLSRRSAGRALGRSMVKGVNPYRRGDGRSVASSAVAATSAYRAGKGISKASSACTGKSSHRGACSSTSNAYAVSRVSRAGVAYASSSANAIGSPAGAGLSSATSFSAAGSDIFLSTPYSNKFGEDKIFVLSNNDRVSILAVI